MGVSTDAYLVYGWKVDEWDEQHCKSDVGIEPDEDEKDEDGEPLEDYISSITLDDTLPYKLVHHCHSEFPMWIFGLRRLYAKAWRGEPVNVGEMMWATPPTQEELDAARMWAVEHKIPIAGEPAWWLCSYSEH